MSRFALCQLVDATPSDEVMRVELPNSGGRRFSVDRIDFAQLASGIGDPMRFEEALVFLRAGYRVSRKAWDKQLTRLKLAGDALVSQRNEGGRTVELTGFSLSADDVLATDWVVLP